MVLGKITVDNSVRYIAKSEQTKEIKLNTIKNKKQIQPASGGGRPNTRKQNKRLSQNNKKWVASGFGILQWIMICYFELKTNWYSNRTNRTKPQETLEFRVSKQMQTFSFNPPINLVEKGKWLLGLSSLECKKSVFNITNENNSFSIFIPDHYRTEFAEKMIIDLNNLLELKSLELHVEDIRKRGNKMKIGCNENKLSDFDTQKKR